MNFSQIIILIMGAFSIIGAIDRIFGNKFGLGKEYENGILTVGQLVLSMIGIMILSPLLADLFSPVITPIYNLIGADPSVFAGSVFACDMGGFPLAKEFASNSQAAQFSGILIASTLGATVSFTIPVALASTEKEDRKYVAKGILCGVVTIPFGIVIGGFTAGFQTSMILINTFPVAILSLLISMGLWKAEDFTIKVFVIFGKLITALATLGLVVIGFETITDFVIIPNLGSFSESFTVVGEIAIVLSGAFPFIVVIKKLLDKPIQIVGNSMGINNTAVAGLIATLANSIATFSMVNKMDDRGKTVNMAFAVSAAFVLGDHLAFTAGVDSVMILPLIVCKLTAGILSVILAFIITKEKKNV